MCLLHPTIWYLPVGKVVTLSNDLCTLGLSQLESNLWKQWDICVVQHGTRNAVPQLSLYIRINACISRVGYCLQFSSAIIYHCGWCGNLHHYCTHSFIDLWIRWMSSLNSRVSRGCCLYYNVSKLRYVSLQLWALPITHQLDQNLTIALSGLKKWIIVQ